jgi:hypothetical protein
MDDERLRRFVVQHGNVSVLDTSGRTRSVAGGGPDIQELMENADTFQWEGLQRSRDEMESLIAQSECGLQPGCAECDRLEQELIVARERDRKEGHVDQVHEMPALARFQDHRISHR